MQIPPWNSEFISFSNAASPAAFFCLKLRFRQEKLFPIKSSLIRLQISVLYLHFLALDNSPASPRQLPYYSIVILIPCKQHVLLRITPDFGRYIR